MPNLALWKSNLRANLISGKPLEPYVPKKPKYSIEPYAQKKAPKYAIERYAQKGPKVRYRALRAKKAPKYAIEPYAQKSSRKYGIERYV